MVILVTGGAGFIASNLIKKLLLKEEQIITIDNFTELNYSNEIKLRRVKEFLGYEDYDLQEIYENKNLTFYKGDIRDEELLDNIFTKHKITQVVHLAALPGVRASIEFPKEYYEVNVIGTINIFEAAKKHDVKSIIYASSSSIYGNTKETPFNEIQRVDNQVSQYAASKKACEEIAAVYHNLYDINVTGLRFFTVYGPWGRPDMAPYIFTSRIYADKGIFVYNNGDMYRDFTFVEDIVQGIQIAMRHDAEHEVFNIGNARVEKLMDFVNIIEKHVGKKARITFKEMQPGDVYTTSADISKLMALGYKPTTSLDQGVKKFVDWYLSYMN